MAAGALVLLLLITAGMVIAIGAGSLPRIEGDYQLSGLDGPVAIARDTHGVPHIEAASERDAYRALGFAQAQDRLWQMEFQRRVGQGRLAEIVGSAALPVDRYLRTLGLYRAAQASLASLDDRSRLLLDAYVQGINDWIEGRDRLLPPEFWLFWHTPETWTAADSAVWIKMMALSLDGDMDAELLRSTLQGQLDPSQLQDLWPGIGSARQAAVDDASALAGLQEAIPKVAGSGVGSNAFAVAASRSSSGSALLAGDPHLDLQSPGVWYLVDMTAPGLKVSGATMPGMPFVVIGRTPNLAWSLTTTGADVQDLFVETVDPADSGRYLVPGGSLLFEVREERLEVRGAPPETLQVRTTRHGPVISDLRGGSADPTRPVSLAWTVLDPVDTTIEAGFQLPRAGDLEALRATLTRYRNPVQNFIAADSGGRVGLFVAGAIPVRQSGDGTMPADGASGAQDWIGTIPAAELPYTIDPAGGTVSNGNDQVPGEAYPHRIATYWPPVWRRGRIDALMADRDHLGQADLVQIQRDHLSGFAVEILPTLLQADVTGDEMTALRDGMAAWDGSMGLDDWRAGLFLAWAERLSRLVREDELGQHATQVRGLRSDFLAHVLTSRPAWCDDLRTSEVESCAAISGRALVEARAALAIRFGQRPEGWTLRRLQHAALPHAVLKNVPVLGRLFGGEVNKAGDPNTVDVAWATVDPSMVQRTVTVAASLRVVVDMADPERLWIVTAGGQSGHPWSRWFFDGARRWERDQRIALPQADRPYQTLLVPSDGAPPPG